MALTDRQKQIKKLLDEGKTPREVGEELGISENAVYQQRRRIAAASKRTNTASKATKTSGKAASKPPARKPAQAAAPAAASPEPTDPLSSVRHRRGQLESIVKEQKTVLDEANAQQQKAQKLYDDTLGKVKTELERLAAAEALLTGKLPVPKPKRKAEAPAPAQEAPAPAQETPAPVPTTAEAGPTGSPTETDGATGSTTEAPVAPQPANEPTSGDPQGNGHVEEERPGVATVPEFSQQEDAFA